jgi:hypothetical protein
MRVPEAAAARRRVDHTSVPPSSGSQTMAHVCLPPHSSGTPSNAVGWHRGIGRDGLGAAPNRSAVADGDAVIASRPVCVSAPIAPHLSRVI